jgi:hypothetical protein
LRERAAHDAEADHADDTFVSWRHFDFPFGGRFGERRYGIGQRQGKPLSRRASIA